MKQNFIVKTQNIIFSTWTMLVLFFLLGAGAAIGTFIENDYGTSTARVLVYNHLWYEIVMTLSIINLLGIIFRRKMWNQKAKFIFHISFVVMLIGASLTRYVGYEGVMRISEGQTQSSMISLEPYFQVTIEHNGNSVYKEFPKEFGAIGNNHFSYDIKFEGKVLNISLDNYTFAKKGSATMNLIGTKVSYNGEDKLIKLVGQRGSSGITRDLEFDDNVHIKVSYGSKPLSIPFAIRLNDFQLDRYPGSMSPSSYASEVTVIDKANNKEFDYRIFMNSTLIYGGYQFFQSSYDPDETGTVLSVNNDPGTIPTYIGYFLLALGLVMNMFDKKSRFMKLTRYIKQFNSILFISVLSLFLTTPSFAVDTNNTIKSDNTTVKYLKTFRDNSKDIANEFGKLVVQSAGRMKPLDSLNTEILNKLSRKSTLLGMEANQVVLGMMSRPDIWQNIKMLKITTPKLKKILGVEKTRKHIAFSEIFDGKNYKLASYVKEVNAMNTNQRGTFEKDVLKLDERLNIAYMVFYGDLFRVFPSPVKDDKSKVKDKWLTPMEAVNNLEDKHKMAVQNMVKGLFGSLANENFKDPIKFIDFISQYQRGVDSKLIPSEDKINNEILFNKLAIFPKLTIAYVVVGIILFIISFLTVFNKKWSSPKINTIFFVILAVLFAIQTYGMGTRWYISGHAPWSDTYESLVYIAWSAMFAGLFFFRKSIMALSATVVMAGVFMFTAHLSGIDPQITNLVPVLKSYWLTIHVSIITASYGFLAIGAMLGFMAMLLFIFRTPNKPHIDDTIKQITAINEASLIIGLAALVIGNFLGGVWANESWGRYWGWDPKETWAWVSIIVYAFVLHLRMIPKLNKPYVFAVASTLAFSSILMTYFGVNFYLSGMHSYATGDPVPIPTWVYVLTAMVFVVIAVSSRKRDLSKLKL
ncbi:MAG: cytochrome c biogenesis protein CcsA [Campylobacterota bacterium]|nr:cytochrome c biogenesis protein CcsA [Campylobacterota bacterium]